MNSCLYAHRSAIASVMITLLLFLGALPDTWSGMAESSIVGVEASTRAEDMAGIRQTMEMKQVQARLADLGYTGEEVQQRLDRLSDREIHELAMNIDQAQKAGWVGFVLAVIFVAAVVVIAFVLIDNATHDHAYE